MTARQRRGFMFWSIQGPGWLFLVYLILAQGISAIDYDLGVAMGTQESAETITEVGAAFFYGFAFADLVFYIPLLMLGLIGHLREKLWWGPVLGAVFGITIYWPVVCLASLVAARKAQGWEIASEGPYWVVLSGITLWGLWGLLTCARWTSPAAR